MAKMNDLTQKVILYFEGTQAMNQLKVLEAQAEKLNQEYEEMKKLQGTPGFDSKKFQALEKQIAATGKEIGSMVTSMKNYAGVLDEMSRASIRQLATARNSLKNLIRGWNEESESDETLQKWASSLEQITARINSLRSGFGDPLAQARDTIGLTVNQLERLREALAAEQKMVANDKEAWNLYGEAIRKVSADMDKIKGEDEESMRARATEVVSKVQGGEYKGTTEQTRENIKLLQEYNAKLNEVGSEPFKEAEEVIAKLNLQLKAATQNLMSYDEAQAKLKRMDELDNQQRGDNAKKLTAAEQEEWESLSKEIDRVRKSIELYKNSLKDGDTEQLKKVNEELRQTQVYANRASVEIDNMDEFLEKGFKTANLEQLQVAAKELEQRIAKAGTKTAEFAANTSKLRQLDKQIKTINKSMEYQGNIILRTAQRLTSYVLVYTGFNEVMGYIRNLTQANLELSDSLADIQKTTGLSVDSVAALSKEIDAIDTRTAQKELHDLAYEAGKLGISAQEDVLGFVKAGNQLLVALGEDLGGAEAVRSLMKVNAILGETQKLGVEKALLATGSAINEITQTSRASAGPINDIVGRIGAIGAAAQMSMPDLIALAGTADALGQHAEVAGTAFNKLITAVQTNTKEIAVNVGIPEGQLRDMMKAGDTMDAIVLILEKMRSMGGLDVLAPMMASFGSDGERIKQVLTTMVGGVDELKAQLFTASRAFEEATSVTNEYNIKNEDAAAIVQRWGNSLKEVVVNSGIVELMTDFLRLLSSIPNVIDRNYQAFRLLASAMAGVVVQLTAVRFGLTDALAKFRLLQWQTYAKPIETFASAMMTASGRAAYLRATMSNLAAVANSVRAAWLKMIVAIQSIKWKQIGTTILNFGKSLFQLSTYTNLVAKGWKALSVVMSSNFIGLALNALASVVTYMALFRDETEKAVQTVNTYRDSIDKETTELDNLRFAIDHANEANGERAALIKQLNDKYGSYLGFMVTEKNYAEEQEYIYGLLNEKLRETIALKMKEKTLDNIVDKYSDLRSEYANAIMEELQGMKNIGDTNKNEAYRTIIQAFNQAIEEDKEYSIDLMQDFKKQYELSGIKFSIGFQENLARLFGVMKNIKKESEQTVKIFSAENEAAGIAQLAEQYGNLTRKEGEGIFGSSDLDNLRTYKEQALTFIQSAQNSISGLTRKIREGQELTKGEKKLYDERIAQIDKVNEGLDKVNARYKEIGQQNLYGKGIGIENMSGDQLESMYKKLNDDYNKLRGDASGAVFTSTTQDAKEIAKQLGLNTEYWEVFKDRASALKWYYEQAKAVRDKMKSMGLNTSGSFIFDDDDGGNEKKTAQQRYKEWIAQLEAYYNERETMIRKKGIEEKKLETEINRELEALKVEKLNDQRELEEGLLNDMYKNSTFDPTKFKGVITGTEYFANLTLEQMRGIVSAGGPKLDAEIRKNMTERMVKLEEQAYKIKQRIDKILLEDDFTEKVAKEYTDALDQLGLLFNMDYESQSRRTEEEGERRLAYMREWAKDSYSLNAQQLQSKMEQEKLFSDWVIKRKPEEYEALLIQLRKFHDDELEAEKKAADRRKKLFDNSEKGMKLKKDAQTAEQNADKNVKTEEEEAKMWDRFKGMDLVSDDKLDEQQIEVGNAQIALYQAKIDASNAYIAQLQLEMAVEKEKVQNTIDNINRELSNTNLSAEQRTKLNADLLAAEQKKNSLIRQEEIITEGEKAKIRENEANQVEVSQDIADRLVAIEQNKISRMKQYTDAIVDFSGQMGEAAFGEVEDRKEAGRQLIKTLLTTLKEHMQVKLTELVMEKMFAQQSTATTAGQVSTEMTLKAAETEADIVAGTASATAKEAGKKGWIGLAVGAAIGAALSALLGLAMGAINKAKSTSDSISGNKKLATGMLTYAEGNYPVLGNDGKVYDAKYEGSNIKTGVYGGGAHFGIFSEKQPEMIVDGKTTQKLILNYPYIYDAITTIAKNGRLVNAMPTFATGDYPAGMQRISGVSIEDTTAQNEAAIAREERTNAIMERTASMLERLSRQIDTGITAHLDGLENYKQQKKNERFLKRRGID